MGPMWSMLVQHVTEQQIGIPRHHLRVLRSGAAPLPHAHAEALAELFGCCVLPTYSMTECMPIAAPPLGYRLERPGSVGRPIGVKLTILDLGVDLEQQAGETGEIALSVAGDNTSHLFAGYGLEGCAPAEAIFRTGDLGYVDEEGWLFVTGRIREMINRGGEVLSPVEIEEALACSAPELRELMVFAVAHDELHEVVGVAVLHPCPLDLARMRELARARLALPQMPQLLVRVTKLPRTASGKLQRAGFAQACGLPALSGAARRSFQFDGGDSSDSPKLRELSSLEATVVRSGELEEFASRSAATGIKAAEGTKVAVHRNPADATPAVGDEEGVESACVSAAEVEAAHVLALARAMLVGEDTAATLDVDTNLADALDSLATIELAEQLRESSGQSLPITIVYDQVTARRIGGYIASMDRAQPVKGGTAPEVPTGPTRCLMLHGLASSGEMMEVLLKAARWVGALEGLEFICIDAPHPHPPQPELFETLAAAGLYCNESYFSHGISGRESDSARCAMLVRESVARVEEELVARAPVHAIGGICDGGLIAALVAARHPELRVYINICGSPWEWLPAALREAPRIQVRSLHLLGRNDVVLTTQELMSLAARCELARCVWHPQGHSVPLLGPRLLGELREVVGGGESDYPPSKEMMAAGRDDETQPDGKFDSMAMLISLSGEPSPQIVATLHMYAIASTFVMFHHAGQALLKDIVPSSTIGMANQMSPFNSFALMMGVWDRARGVPWARVRTELRISGMLLLLTYYTAFPECIAALYVSCGWSPALLASDPSVRATASDGSTNGLIGRFTAPSWWFLAAIVYRSLAYLSARCGVRAQTLGAISVFVHFASGPLGWAPWPMQRGPLHRLDSGGWWTMVARALPLARPPADLCHLWMFYAAVPHLLPRDFPATPLPRHLPRLVFAVVAVVAGMVYRHTSAFGSLPYACAADGIHRQPACARLAARGSLWSAHALFADALSICTQLVMLVCFAGLLPRRRVPLLTSAGQGPLAAFFLHIYLTPWTDVLGHRVLGGFAKLLAPIPIMGLASCLTIVAALGLCFLLVCAFAAIGRVVHRVLDAHAAKIPAAVCLLLFGVGQRRDVLAPTCTGEACAHNTMVSPSICPVCVDASGVLDVRCCSAGRTRVLFIGNSLLSHLPEAFELVAAKLRLRVVVSSVALYGCCLRQTLSQNQTRLALSDSQGWDFVVLQEFSDLPTLRHARQTFWHRALRDVRATLRASSHRRAKLVLMMTWGRARGFERRCPAQPKCVANLGAPAPAPAVLELLDDEKARRCAQAGDLRPRLGSFACMTYSLSRAHLATLRRGLADAVAPCGLAWLRARRSAWSLSNTRACTGIIDREYSRPSPINLSDFPQTPAVAPRIGRKELYARGDAIHASSTGVRLNTAVIILTLFPAIARDDLTQALTRFRVQGQLIGTSLARWLTQIASDARESCGHACNEARA